jgi:Mrp family chromosome partitioning ATPase
MLIDAPGTSVCGDAQLLSLVADAAILVIEANSTRRLTARKAKESLDAAGVRLLGTVLNNRSFPIPEKLYRKL